MTNHEMRIVRYMVDDVTESAILERMAVVYHGSSRGRLPEGSPSQVRTIYQGITISRTAIHTRDRAEDYALLFQAVGTG